MIIWYKDQNRRVYHDKNGVKHSSPIEREYWVPYDVVKETTRSWVLGNGIKVPKSTKLPTHCFAADEQQVDDVAWFDDNLAKITHQVSMLGFGMERYDNIAKLRQIASLIDYKPAP